MSSADCVVVGLSLGGTPGHVLLILVVFVPRCLLESGWMRETCPPPR